MKFQEYQKNCRSDFQHRYLPFSLWEECLEELKQRLSLDILEIGRSVQQRPINRIKIGSGRHKVLIWSQMHGNESTGTMAVLDLIEVLHTESSESEKVLNDVEIHIIPMLNPDGAQLFRRENYLHIDINRDARSRETPELQALINYSKIFDFDWAFNLHDQRNIFTVGKTGKEARISFLAPSFNEEREINEIRGRSIFLIADMKKALGATIEPYIGRYTDEYYPRAIGEYFMNEGVSTVLFECGASFKDYSRWNSRLYCGYSMYMAVNSIISGGWESQSEDNYWNIEENTQFKLDLIFRNAIEVSSSIKSSLGYLTLEKLEKGELERILEFNTNGDLHDYHGFTEIEELVKYEVLEDGCIRLYNSEGEEIDLAAYL